MSIRDRQQKGGCLKSPNNIITLVLVVLKLAGVIDWSWWLVLLPTWGVMVFTLALFGFISLFESID